MRGCTDGVVDEVVCKENDEPGPGGIRNCRHRACRDCSDRLGRCAAAVGIRHAGARHPGQGAAVGVSRRALGHHHHHSAFRFCSARHCDLAVQSPESPGADADLPQHRHRGAVDGDPGADLGHDRDSVLQADVLHGPGTEPGHDNQSYRASVVLVLRLSYQGDLSFDSNIIPENELKPGQKRLLDVDNPLVVPVDTVIRVYVTGTDVIHSWFIPSFGVQEYAVVGRLNESWMKVEHPGIYYGQCNQICGVNHAFMPIKVEAVNKDEFQRWLEDAKKKYARHDERGEAVHVAAASDATGVARPAPAGN